MSTSAWTPVDEKHPGQNSAWTPVEEAQKDWRNEPLAMSHPSFPGQTRMVPRHLTGDYVKNGWTAGPAPSESSGPGFMKNAGRAAKAFASDVGSTISSVGKSLNPMPTKEQLSDPAHMATFALPGFAPALIQGAKAQYSSSVEMQRKAREAADKGDTAKSMVYSVGAGLPLVGPLVNGVYEQAESGDTAGAIGTGLSRSLQAATMAPEGSAIPNPLAKVNAAFGKAITPKHPLARVLPGVSNETAATAAPHIQAAATDMGLDLRSASANDVLAAAKQAKQNVLLNAQESAGPGKTLFDIAPEEQDLLKQRMQAIGEVEKSIADAQKKAAANSKSNIPATRGQAAINVAKGAGKMAVADTVGSMVPGGRLVADAVGIGAGGAQAMRGIKGLIRPGAVTPEILDTRLQQAFKQIPAQDAMGAGVPPEPQESASPWQPVEGDLSVQHTGVPSPPETAGGEVPVTPVQPIPRAASQVVAPPRPALDAPQEWQGPLPQREPIGEPSVQPAAAQEATPRTFTPLKAKTPAAAQTEVLKKAGVAAPKATQQPFAGEVPGPVLKPREFEVYPEADGEKAAAQSLTHYTINELRAIAQQREIKVAPGDTHINLIEKIHDDLTPEEIQDFHEASTKQAQERQQSGFTPHPDNKAIADSFRQQADDLEAKGGKPYDVAAYRQGAHTIENHPQPIGEMESKEIQKLPGIGKKLGQQIEDYRQANKPAQADDLETQLKQQVTAAKDTDMMAQARTELGPKASLSSVARRAWELKYKPDAESIRQDIAGKQGTPVGEHLKDAYGKIPPDEQVVQADSAGKNRSGQADSAGSGSGNKPKAPTVSSASKGPSQSGSPEGKTSQNSASQLRAQAEDRFYSARAKALLGIDASVEEIAVKAKELKATAQRSK